MSWDLKDPKEVEEYMNNLEIEYKFGCYKEKKPIVCHLLGDFYEAVRGDHKKAAKLYKDNCDESSHGHSCFKYGNYAFLGRGGVESSHKTAVEYYEKGCKLKYGDACLQAGLMSISGKSNVPKDEKKALKCFDEGCDLNNATACYFYSAMFINGLPNILEKDMPKAFKYASKACELGNIYACANLSQMYKKGDGVEKDEKKAEEIKQIALDMQKQHNEQFRGIEFGKGGF